MSMEKGIDHRGRTGKVAQIGSYAHYTEMPVHGIHETLSVFLSIYAIYPYKAGG